MREIKFRAWNEWEECFVDSEEFAINFLGTVFKANLDNEVYNNLMNQNTLKIMQYTGSKDKNNVEIYEGDILKTWHGEEDISYDDEDNEVITGFLITEVVDYNKVNVRHEDFDLWILDWAMDNQHEFEIIGNIYENPELLEKYQ